MSSPRGSVGRASFGPPASTDNPIMKSFLFGQYGNLFKFSVWWVSLSPFIFALTNSTSAVGVTRIIYNLAICVLSPLGAILVEKVSPRSLLTTAAAVRFLLWVVVCPALGILSYMQRDEHGQPYPHINTACYAVIAVMMAVDGLAVASSVILDIDVCGVDMLASWLNIEVTDEDRNYYNARSEGFFSLCFIVFAPAIAWIGLLYRKAITDDTSGGDGLDDGVESLVLSLIFGSTFLLGTGAQVFFFAKIPPTKGGGPATAGNPEGQDLEDALMLSDHHRMGADDIYNDGDERQGNRSGTLSSLPDNRTWQAIIANTAGELGVAMSILRKHPPLLFRIIFLGLEIAVEDSVIAVVLAHCGLKLEWMGNDDAVYGNIWSAMLIACGKLGALLASTLMAKYYKPPSSPAGFRVMFIFVGISSLFTIGFPIAVHFREGATEKNPDPNLVSENVARAIFFISSFFFFLFSALPKIGFMMMLQSMVSTIEHGHRVFGFIAIVAMICDAGMVMALSAVIEGLSSLQLALYVCSAVFVAHGLLEVFLGPCLVLRGLAPDLGAGERGSPTDKRGGYVPHDDLGEEFDRTSLNTIHSVTNASASNSTGSRGASAPQPTSRSQPTRESQYEETHSMRTLRASSPHYNSRGSGQTRQSAFSGDGNEYAEGPRSLLEDD